jgi:hypothetical protein
LSLSRGTAHRYVAAASPDELLMRATSRENKLDRYKPYLRQRWNEGITTATVLHTELQAHGIRRDQQAVTAGLTLPHSSAAVEGNVTRIKMIKRQMYGRAGFALLRKRVILHPGSHRSRNPRQSHFP